jgi:hypothetical protein
MTGAGPAPVQVVAARWLGAITATALLAGCGRQAPADALFPLSAGHRWTYRVTTQWSDGKTEQDTLTLMTLGEEPLPAGVGGEGTAWRRHADDGMAYWLRADAAGIRRVAARALFDAAARPDPPQRFVLKAPYTVGTQWEASTTAYLLTRRFDFPREVRYTYPPVSMAYRIEAENEKVETPAGSFSACLRVRGSATMRVYADPVGGWRDVPLTTLEWYCRGVGLVRLERQEPAPSSFMAGGSRVMVLQAFR